ncbi:MULTISPECIES: geranylgeranyl reductase family protein [Haloarcula]|uniref:Geranylgeranyl hydrogenase n=2 Tax=Haloarcula marismortui TaxID=2238 RepID=M0K4C9_9EURY|nr:MULTISPECIES: geranylgeranyl reductase family protein [Haloarcula]EMA15663.1 geranylgeranyl hydrogenase [Haloarcula sinaiiensis ATCC 33800]EMA20303.1 geranylgeranyl hydrogenase [Haloarcula californiae ATCC 33799]NHX40312.1 geranylgeranyl reductase family protein [Haloarcula sp. R1-2]QUJ72227.1 geranylgeranyl reductase family protein [Haloarcula sinaiiensis ATCC 33800]
MYDVVVVGAGPAGSRYARQAASRGLDVVVFEQGEIGKPLACSGHVSTDIWEFTEDARDELFQNEISGARFHTGGPGSQDHPFYKDEVISNVIDRVGLDKHLAEVARDAGADVREEHSVVGVTEDRDSVTVEVRGDDGVETHRAKMVAGCDGPKSRVRRELDLPEPDELLHGVLGFSDEVDHGDFVDVHLTVPRFFAWRIPRGEAGVEYGLAVPPGDDARGRFEEFVDGYGVETDHRCSGLIPIGPPKRVTGRRSFLIGDAAAQTKPFTGGGIRYGMTAADHAAREIDPEDPATLGEYERAWRDDLRQEIRLGHAVRAGYSAPEPIQKAGMKAFEGEIGVHMDRPTTLFSREQLAALFSRS